MTRTLLHLALLFSLPCLVRSVSAAEVVVVEAPAADSRTKLFEFPGGTPEQFVAQLKKVYGSFGYAVTMEDETAGHALPAAKVFASDAISAAKEALPQRLQVSSSDGWFQLRFIAGNGENADPFAKAPAAGEGAASKAPAKILFRFPGGTPAELISALDKAFGCHLTEIATIAPEIAAARIPVLQMKAEEAWQVLEMLNNFSMNTAGTTGYWGLMRRDGESVATAAEADALVVAPRYDERNPSPGMLAEAASSSAEMRALREQAKKIVALESNLSQANQTLQQLQEQLRKLESKGQ
ncbi:MAG: hypothetical protein V4726_25215 [Verrucomicrobiota bacterium]